MSDKEIALKLTQLIYSYKNPSYTGTPQKLIEETYKKLYNLVSSLK